MKKKILSAFLFFQSSAILLAQPFTDLQNGFPTLGNASTAWGDYDNDGDLDFAVIGFSGVTAEVGSIYRNDGNGIFTLAFSLDFPVSSGALSWGDYDHDGDLDLLVNGQNGSGGPLAITTLYRNEGNSLFTAINNALPGVIGISRWIDYDGDGWLDIVMSGIGNSITNDSTWLIHNDTNGVFTQVSVNLPGYYASDISVVDFNNDGKMDFFLTGGSVSPSVFPITKLYQNNGNGIFTEVLFNFKNLSTGTSVWADYDNDGDKDLLYNGIDSSFTLAFTMMYRNDGNGNFSLINTNLPGSGEPGSVDWADMDNDGDLDILLGGPETLLRNDGNNVFSDITPVNFQQSVPCSFADIDNDGDLDILLISQSGGFTASTIHRNEIIMSVDESNYSDYFFTYPNPVVGVLNIHSVKKMRGALEYVLTNITGEEVFNHQINNSSADFSIDVASLQPALYFLTIRQNSLMIYSGKIIVQ